MRIVFFGSPQAALPSLAGLLGAGHTVALAITQPDKPAGRGRRVTACPVKVFAREHGIPTIEPGRIRKDAGVLDRIREAAPDVQVVVAYGQIIPDPVIYYPRYHTLNVHFSLLPRYRGAAPVQWAILDGERETGVTIIELNDRMDEGPVLARSRTAVEPRETATALEARLAEMGAELLLETLDHLDGLTAVPQDDGQASLAPKIRPEDARIDWREGAEKTDRRVRAMTVRPGAFTLLRGRRILVLRGRALEVQAPGRRPGEVVAVDKNGLQVSCGDGSVYLIEELQPEGRRPMTAHAFSLGARTSPGTLLGEV